MSIRPVTVIESYISPYVRKVLVVLDLEGIAYDVRRVLDHPSFMKLRPFEEMQMRTPIPKQREALREAGAPITAESLGTSSPKRGVLST